MTKGIGTKSRSTLRTAPKQNSVTAFARIVLINCIRIWN